MRDLDLGGKGTALAPALCLSNQASWRNARWKNRSRLVPLLYVADFRAGTIDVFDGKFHKVPVPAGFVDANLPANYAPFDIANIGGKLHVTYAEQDAPKHDDEAGPGNGFIDVYSLDGILLQRVVTRGALNGGQVVEGLWGLIFGNKPVRRTGSASRPALLASRTVCSAR